MKLKPIRNSQEYEVAKTTLSRLMQENNDGRRTDDIEVLALLIEQFEQTHEDILPPTPVEAIKFRMSESGLLPRDLEPYIGSRARVSEVLSGKRSLSIDMIRSLHEGLGIPYVSLIARRNAATVDKLQVSDSAIRHMNRHGFAVEQKDLPSFLESSLAPSFAPALHRKTHTQRAASKMDPTALLLWQAAVLKKVQATPSTHVDYARSHLSTEVLRRLAMLSSKHRGPLKAIDFLRELGIETVILPPLPGTYLDGAAMLTPQGRPVIGLTLRHDRVDNFWFTLLHEAAHVHLHYQKLEDERSAFIDDIEIRSADRFEMEADNLAQVALIPDSILAHIKWDKHSTSDDLIAVASRARVSTSIVAGRWQRDHQNYRRFARLIERNVITPMLKELRTS